VWFGWVLSPIGEWNEQPSWFYFIFVQTRLCVWSCHLSKSKSRVELCGVGEILTVACQSEGLKLSSMREVNENNLLRQEIDHSICRHWNPNDDVWTAIDGWQDEVVPTVVGIGCVQMWAALSAAGWIRALISRCCLHLSSERRDWDDPMRYRVRQWWQWDATCHRFRGPGGQVKCGSPLIVSIVEWVMSPLCRHEGWCRHLCRIDSPDVRCIIPCVGKTQGVMVF